MITLPMVYELVFMIEHATYGRCIFISSISRIEKYFKIFSSMKLKLYVLYDKSKVPVFKRIESVSKTRNVIKNTYLYYFSNSLITVSTHLHLEDDLALYIATFYSHISETYDLYCHDKLYFLSFLFSKNIGKMSIYTNNNIYTVPEIVSKKKFMKNDLSDFDISFGTNSKYSDILEYSEYPTYTSEYMLYDTFINSTLALNKVLNGTFELSCPRFIYNQLFGISKGYNKVAKTTTKKNCKLITASIVGDRLTYNDLVIVKNNVLLRIVNV